MNTARDPGIDKGITHDSGPARKLSYADCAGASLVSW